MHPGPPNRPESPARGAEMPMKQALMRFFLWAVLGLAGLCTAQAQPAAEVRSATGVVFSQPPGGQVKVVQTGAKLSVGETVGTQKGAFALIVFNDGSRVALRPESALAIRGFSFKPEDPANDQMSVQLLKGWLRNVSGQIGKRGNESAFDMKVADTTIGIRGTDFAVRLCDEECAAGNEPNPEGVLPQSGRLGQLLSSSQTVLRFRDGVTPQSVGAEGALFLGDALLTGDAEALVGLDDGTRIVLGPRTSVALRAEEDNRGRRAVRLDVLQGTLRVVTAPQPAARLYGLLVNAGELLGVRQDTAVDVSCEQTAAPGAFSCPAAVALLRRGRSEVLSTTGLRSLAPAMPQRLAEPDAAPAPPAPLAPGRTTSQRPAQEWDTWAPGAHPLHSLRTYAQWRQGQARAQDPVSGTTWLSAQLLAQAAPTTNPSSSSAGTGNATPAPRTSGLFDPNDIPRDTARPSSAGERPQQGVYVATFEGLVSLTTPGGQILIAAGQGGYAPSIPAAPPRFMPAAPRFMEQDVELERSKLYPGQCPR